MNENIDLIKILKNCPEGFELYTPLLGKVSFWRINKDTNFPIIVKSNPFGIISFTKGGYYMKYTPDGECLLFPSKEMRDWSKFIAPWNKKEKFDPMTLQPFDRVIARSTLNSKWRCTFFSHLIDDERCILKCITSDYSYPFCIPYNDETKHLAGTTEEAPEYYRYWKN